MYKTKSLLSLPTVILASFILIFLGGCVQTQKQKLVDSGATKLNDMELKELVTDSVATWSNPQGAKGMNVYKSDGTATADWNGPNGSGSTKGRWVIKNDSLCTKWQKVRKGREMCFTMFKTGDNEFTGFRPDGSLAGTNSFSKL